MRSYCLLSILLLWLATAASAQGITVIGNSPFVLGETIQVRSGVLSENRTLNIYLPEGYKDADTARYPVIYLLDGSADEDFIHVAGLVQFANFPWVNLLPRSVVVGIANVDRKRDFTFPTTVDSDRLQFPTTGGSARFIAFIEKELQPFIDSTYRTTRQNTLIGQSLGGLVATEILFTRPRLFARYMIVSPSLWWDRGSLLNKALPAPSLNNTSVYIAVGNEGREMEEYARKLHGLLKKFAAAEFGYFPWRDHATIFHEAVYRAFEYFNGSMKK